MIKKIFYEIRKLNKIEYELPSNKKSYYVYLILKKFNFIFVKPPPILDSNFVDYRYIFITHNYKNNENNRYLLLKNNNDEIFYFFNNKIFAELKNIIKKKLIRN